MVTLWGGGCLHWVVPGWECEQSPVRGNFQPSWGLVGLGHDPHSSLAFLSFQIGTRRCGQAAGLAGAIMAGKERMGYVGKACK